MLLPLFPNDDSIKVVGKPMDESVKFVILVCQIKTSYSVLPRGC